MQDIISHSLDNHTQSPHRDYLFDNIKALLIFLVAAVHFEAAVRSAYGACPVTDMLMLTASSFHMPLFMIISGYFSKHVKRDRITDTVIIYLTAQALFFVYDFFLTYDMSLKGISLVRLLSPGFSMWYLFALVWLRLFHKELSQMKYPVAISAVVSIAVMGSAMDTAGRQAIVKTLAHALYFIIGLRITPEHIHRLRRLPKALFAAGIAAGAGVLRLITIASGIISPHTLRLMTIRAQSADNLGGGVRPYLMYVFVTVLALFMSAMIVGIMPDKPTFFSVFGRNTVTVYIAQAFVYLMLRAAAGRLTGFIPSYLMNIFAAALAIACVAATGNNRVAGLFNKWIQFVEKLAFKVI